MRIKQQPFKIVTNGHGSPGPDDEKININNNNTHDDNFNNSNMNELYDIMDEHNIDNANHGANGSSSLLDQLHARFNSNNNNNNNIEHTAATSSLIVTRTGDAYNHHIVVGRDSSFHPEPTIPPRRSSNIKRTFNTGLRLNQSLANLMRVFGQQPTATIQQPSDDDLSSRFERVESTFLNLKQKLQPDVPFSTKLHELFQQQQQIILSQKKLNAWHNRISMEMRRASSNMLSQIESQMELLQKSVGACLVQQQLLNLQGPVETPNQHRQQQHRQQQQHQHQHQQPQQSQRQQQHQKQPQQPQHQQSSQQQQQSQSDETACQSEFYCNEPGCGKSFPTLRKLRHHHVVHSDDYPFVCEIDGCSKRFKRKFGIDLHSTTHFELVPKMYTKTSNSSSLPFFGRRMQYSMCKPCGKKFKTVQEYQYHMMRHGEEPFKCPVKGCGQKFSIWKSFQKHRASHYFNYHCRMDEKCKHQTTNLQLLKLHIYCCHFRRSVPADVPRVIGGSASVSVSGSASGSGSESASAPASASASPDVDQCLDEEPSPKRLKPMLAPRSDSPGPENQLSLSVRRDVRPRRNPPRRTKQANLPE